MCILSNLIEKATLFPLSGIFQGKEFSTRHKKLSFFTKKDIVLNGKLAKRNETEILLLCNKHT